MMHPEYWPFIAGLPYMHVLGGGHAQHWGTYTGRINDRGLYQIRTGLERRGQEPCFYTTEHPVLNLLTIPVVDEEGQGDLFASPD